MTLVEIRPHRWGWRVFECHGVEPVLGERDHAIDYASSRGLQRANDLGLLMRIAAMESVTSCVRMKIDGVSRTRISDSLRPTEFNLARLSCYQRISGAAAGTHAVKAAAHRWGLLTQPK